jgi:GAF domain-containing protein
MMTESDGPTPSISQKRTLAERALAAVRSLTNARTTAVFCPNGPELALFASAAVDQQALDLAAAAWKNHAGSLGQGEMLYSAELHTDRRFAALPLRGAPAAFVLVPAFSEDRLVALLYADSGEPYFCTRHDQQRLSDLSGLIGQALAAEGARSLPAEESWSPYLEAADPVFSKQRDELLLLLNRTDWNIARVARLLGVSRRTLYVRLAKYRIPREHVQKKGTGGRRTGRGTSETRTYPRFGSTFVVPTHAKIRPPDDGSDPPEGGDSQ